MSNEGTRERLKDFRFINNVSIPKFSAHSSIAKGTLDGFIYSGKKLSDDKLKQINEAIWSYPL